MKSSMNPVPNENVTARAVRIITQGDYGPKWLGKKTPGCQMLWGGVIFRPDGNRLHFEVPKRSIRFTLVACRVVRVEDNKGNILWHKAPA